MVPVFRLALLGLSSCLLITEAYRSRDLVENWKPTQPGEIYKVSRLANYALSLNTYGRPTYDILGRVLTSEKRVDGLDTVYHLVFSTYPTFCSTARPLNVVACKRGGQKEVRLCEAEVVENHDGKDVRVTKFECQATPPDL